MNYIALYRKWRPMTFDEVVEQESVVAILKNAVKSRRIAHSYLFCGTRGTGKTSIAKIFSRAINCTNTVDGNPCNQCEVCKGILNESILDVLEIDAASNNGVDNIRNIIDESSYHSTKAEYKVFIIDEVHMLSMAAFNALLKTLEEPPENVVFILATTEPQKLPVTILSRCQRYTFKRISRDGIKTRLEEICQSMNVSYDESALAFLSGKADGAMRDAISLLDQTISSCIGAKITLDIARRSVGSLDRETIEGFCSALFLRDSFAIVSLVDKIFSEGADPSVFICELIEYMRELLVVLSTRKPGNLIYETGEDLDRLVKTSEMTNIKELSMFIKELAELENSLKWAVQRKIIFEAGMLSLCDRSWGKDTEISDRMLTLERNVADLAASGLKTVYSGVVPMPREAEKTSSEKEPQPPKIIQAPKSMPAKENLKKADEKDWKDFKTNLMDVKLASVSSIFDLYGTAYPIGDYLYISIDNDAMLPMLKVREREKIYDDCASRAFGREIHVQIEAEDLFKEKIPGLLEETKKSGLSEKEFKEQETEKSLQKILAKQEKQSMPIEKVVPDFELPPENTEASEATYEQDDSDEPEEFIEDFNEEED